MILTVVLGACLADSQVTVKHLMFFYPVTGVLGGCWVWVFVVLFIRLFILYMIREAPLCCLLPLPECSPWLSPELKAAAHQTFLYFFFMLNSMSQRFPLNHHVGLVALLIPITCLLVCKLFQFPHTPPFCSCTFKEFNPWRGLLQSSHKKLISWWIEGPIKRN